MVKELTIISGKGGTGKTSIAASFSALASSKVIADCDVDAADLHLVLSPKINRAEVFIGGVKATVNVDQCIGCGKCASVCRFDAIFFDGPANDVVGKTYCIDSISCEGCGVCAHVCPTSAISLFSSPDGEWYVSETRHGPLVHAKLGVARGNSGKLVTLIRKEAVRIAEENGLELVVIDGAPGIGCPVIASITGASLALIVTEPSLSGIHDLQRVADLAAHLRVPAVVCVNKSDINIDARDEIRRICRQRNIEIVGEIRYDTSVTRAQIDRKSVVEYGIGPAHDDIKSLWDAVSKLLA